MGAAKIVLLDIAEHGLNELMHDPALASIAVPIVGDVCDASLLHEIFSLYRPHIVFHAAAAKHVWLMEKNPFTAVRTNVLGTSVALAAAHRGEAEQFILLSTDKAVDPASMMGATKRIAELQILASRGPAAAKALRLGNVLGSTGSIVPAIQQSIAQGRAITITDASCERYFVSPKEATLHLLGACEVQGRESILAGYAGRPRNIMDLVSFLLPSGSLPIHYCGLRSGEKRLQASSWPGLQLVQGPCQQELSLKDLFKALETRDPAALLKNILKIVPNYEPSSDLLALAHAQVSA
jgi:FlaA1/EpsC-like NDP-sugar epimerase